MAITRMPSEKTYDADTQTLRLGDGEWGPVRPEVINYASGAAMSLTPGSTTARRNRRQATSPLEDIHVESWPSEWTIELIDLLRVLTRLVELEPTQADMLDRILAGPIARKDDLAARGVNGQPRRRTGHRGVQASAAGRRRQPTLGDA